MPWIKNEGNNSKLITRITCFVTLLLGVPLKLFLSVVSLWWKCYLKYYIMVSYAHLFPMLHSKMSHRSSTWAICEYLCHGNKQTVQIEAGFIFPGQPAVSLHTTSWWASTVMFQAGPVIQRQGPRVMSLSSSVPTEDGASLGWVVSFAPLSLLVVLRCAR